MVEQRMRHAGGLIGTRANVSRHPPGGDVGHGHGAVDEGG